MQELMRNFAMAGVVGIEAVEVEHHVVANGVGPLLSHPPQIPGIAYCFDSGVMSSCSVTSVFWAEIPSRV